MKSNATLQDKLTKQNEIGRQRLAQELVKLEKMEKSNLRMIETARHRFRSRHKNLETQQQQPIGSKAINVRMYETHNPGFCYHCTGAIKETGHATKKEQTPKDSYEFVRSIVFTKGEVDPDKVLCLHLLTAHSTKWNENDGVVVRPVTPLLEKAKNRHFSGSWNNLIPCYVVDTQVTSSNVKLHEDPRTKILEEQAVHAFEEKYKQYVENEADGGNVFSANLKNPRTILHGFEKMPAISPHVYSLLGASHELRIKQALAEGMTRRKFGRSSTELNGLDENSLSFRLDDDDDVFSRVTANLSTRNWITRSTRSPSRRSAAGSSLKLDYGITMLRSKRKKNFDGAPKDLIIIKSSLKTMKDAPSKTSSTKSPFHSAFGSRPSTNSLLSATLSPDLSNRRYGKSIYLNAPVKCVELRNKDYTVVPVLVNYQIQALVQTVFEVLQRVNPEKTRKILETARDAEKINKMLLKPEMQNFVQTLVGQSLVSSPESFVLSIATLADEIDLRFEGILDKEIIALTLEVPSLPSLDTLVAEIRNNIFVETKKETQMKKNEENDGAQNLSSEEKNKKDGETSDNLKKDANQKRPKIPAKKKLLRWNKRSELNKCVECMSDRSKENNAMHGTEGNCDRNLRTDSSINPAEQIRLSGNIPAKRTSNSKTWKSAQDLGHLDANHVILRRMTNPQRILVGQMCASLKTKRINNQGLINESVPLAALIAPALSRDSIKFLTRGTAYSKANASNEQEETEDTVIVPDKLTGPLLAKIRQDVAEIETKQRLKYFLKNDV